jgi:hypothetical protein
VPKIDTIKPVGLTPREYAKARHCSLATVYNRLNRGELRAVKDGIRTLILDNPYDVSRLPAYEPGHKPRALRSSDDQPKT